MQPINAARAAFAGLLFGLLALPSARAQDYPNRAVTLVVPYPAGGGLDTLARQLGQKLADRLGKPVVVENRTGAGTVIGAASVAKAAPDGYTIMLGTSTPFAITVTLEQEPALRSGAGFRTHCADLECTLPPARASLAAGSLGRGSRCAREVEAAAILLWFGRTGLAAASELRAAQEHDRHRRPARARFAATAPALTNLVAGHIPMMFGEPTPVLPLLRDGKVRALAVSSATRLPVAPEIPTMAEAGLPASISPPGRCS